MGRRLVGTVMFLGVAISLFEIGGRLALEQKATWGWFLISGLMLSGVALNLWTGEVPQPNRQDCQKPRDLDDFD